jgi:hypothetical protein
VYKVRVIMSLILYWHKPNTIKLLFIERKIKQWWKQNPSTKQTIISFQMIEGKKDHNICRWKSSSWLGTGTKMYRAVNWRMGSQLSAFLLTGSATAIQI